MRIDERQPQRFDPDNGWHLVRTFIGVVGTFFAMFVTGVYYDESSATYRAHMIYGLFALTVLLLHIVTVLGRKLRAD